MENAKKLIVKTHESGYKSYFCPTCHECLFGYYKYCPMCGQKIESINEFKVGDIVTVSDTTWANNTWCELGYGTFARVAKDYTATVTNVDKHGNITVRWNRPFKFVCLHGPRSSDEFSHGQYNPQLFKLIVASESEYED